MFTELASQLLRWRPLICPDNDPATLSQIQQYSDWLLCAASSLHKNAWNEWAIHHTRGRGGHHGFGEYGQQHSHLASLHFLVCSLSARIGGSKSLKHVILQAVNCLPPQMSAVVRNMVNGAFVPSAAVICRGRLCLDAAWMLHMREVHASMISSDSILWGAQDSSPQGGRN